MVDKNPITPDGAQKLREELHRRKTVDRPQISQMIAEARAHGDLSENAEYHAARERGGFNEGRIKELEDKLARAEIIDPSKLAGDKVAFGATVKLLNTSTDEEVTYRILGADEADINAGSISITAPIAKSLLGKEVGDEVKIRTPAGERVYEILEIEFEITALSPLDPVDKLPGLGAAAKRALAEHGITTVLDLLWTAPSGWDDLRSPRALRDVVAETALEGSAPVRATFAGIVESATLVPVRRRRGVRVVVRDADDTKCKIHLFWFFAAHGILGLAKPGLPVLVTARVTTAPGKPPRAAHPDLLADTAETRTVKPRYPRLGPSPAVVRRAIGHAVAALGPESSVDPVPPSLATRMRPAVELVRRIHGAAGDVPDDDDRRAFVERLAWAEAFTRTWERLLVDESLSAVRGVALPPAPPETRARLERELGFTLTAEQREACAAIATELASAKPMRRLLLGDVGSGKTAVALMAIAQCVEAGRQAVFLAPTSVLAEQTLSALRPLERATKARVAFFTGDMPTDVRRESARAIASGEADVAVGTHALLGADVTFAKLGLVVVDEQQRLGVAQRLSLVAKGDRPHLLTLSATPIPRTLALALRGELATSTLRERPAGRGPVATSLASVDRLADVVERVRAAVERDERVYWVVPRVEDIADEDEDADEGLGSLEERTKALRRSIGKALVGAIHGRMKGEEKRSAMRDFREGKVPVLVGTTVIEVGLDVPEATLIVIENAERYGLAQLHQLRGRVGRGDRPGSCVLLHDVHLDAVARRRLDSLGKHERGEDIARVDLELRGAGDLGGTRQHGEEDELLYLDPGISYPWLEHIEADARTLRRADPTFDRPEHRVLGAFVARRRRAIAAREEAG